MSNTNNYATTAAQTGATGATGSTALDDYYAQLQAYIDGQSATGTAGSAQDLVPGYVPGPNTSEQYAENTTGATTGTNSTTGSSSGTDSREYSGIWGSYGDYLASLGLNMAGNVGEVPSIPGQYDQAMGAGTDVVQNGYGQAGQYADQIGGMDQRDISQWLDNLGDVNVGQTSTQNWNENAYQAYVNPYNSAVRETTLTDLQKKQAEDKAALQAKQAASRSFGSRADIAQGQMAADQNSLFATTSAKLNAEGYDKANAMWSADQNRSLDSQKANQAADISREQIESGNATAAIGAQQTADKFDLSKLQAGLQGELDISNSKMNAAQALAALAEGKFELVKQQTNLPYERLNSLANLLQFGETSTKTTENKNTVGRTTESESGNKAYTKNTQSEVLGMSEAEREALEDYLNNGPQVPTPPDGVNPNPPGTVPGAPNPDPSQPDPDGGGGPNNPYAPGTPPPTTVPPQVKPGSEWDPALGGWPEDTDGDGTPDRVVDPHGVPWKRDPEDPTKWVPDVPTPTPNPGNPDDPTEDTNGDGVIDEQDKVDQPGDPLTPDPPGLPDGSVVLPGGGYRDPDGNLYDNEGNLLPGSGLTMGEGQWNMSVSPGYFKDASYASVGGTASPLNLTDEKAASLTNRLNMIGSTPFTASNVVVSERGETFQTFSWPDGTSIEIRDPGTGRVTVKMPALNLAGGSGRVTPNYFWNPEEGTAEFYDIGMYTAKKWTLGPDDPITQVIAAAVTQAQMSKTAAGYANGGLVAPQSFADYVGDYANGGLVGYADGGLVKLDDFIGAGAGFGTLNLPSGDPYVSRREPIKIDLAKGRQRKPAGFDVFADYADPLSLAALGIEMPSVRDKTLESGMGAYVNRVDPAGADSLIIPEELLAGQDLPVVSPGDYDALIAQWAAGDPETPADSPWLKDEVMAKTASLLGKSEGAWDDLGNVDLENFEWDPLSTETVVGRPSSKGYDAVMNAWAARDGSPVQSVGKGYLAQQVRDYNLAKDDFERRKAIAEMESGNLKSRGTGYNGAADSWAKGFDDFVVGKSASKPSSVSEYEYAKANGYDGGYMDFVTSGKKAGATTVNVGSNGTDFGEPEKGLVWGRNPDGTVRLDERGAPVAIPYQGGSVFMEMDEKGDKKQLQSDQRARYSNVVTQDIDRALAIMKEDEENGWLPATGSLAGVIPSTTIADWLSESEAGKVARLLQTIKANIGFDRLQQMREASPTGGALGSVSKTEMDDLQAVAGSVAQTQSHQELVDNLNRVWNMTQDIVHGKDAGPERRPLSFEQSQETKTSAKAGTVSGLKWSVR